MNQYKILWSTLFINAQENVIFGNENEYNDKMKNASYAYQDFHEANAQKTLKPEDITFDYFARGIQEAKNDMLEAFSNFNLSYNDIDFYIKIQQNVQSKKISIFVTFFAYCNPFFTQYAIYMNSVSQSTQNLIAMALEKIKA